MAQHQTTISAQVIVTVHGAPQSPFAPRKLPPSSFAPRKQRYFRGAKGDFAGRAAALLAALGLSIAGCGRAGPPIASVSGTIRIDGQPLTEGLVCFASPEGFAASAPVKPDGTFRLGSQYGKGIPLGTYRVTIVPPAPAGLTPMIPTAAAKVKQQSSSIPAKYRNLQSSDLTAVVKADGGTFNFDLKNAKP